MWATFLLNLRQIYGFTLLVLQDNDVGDYLALHYSWCKLITLFYARCWIELGRLRGRRGGLGPILSPP